MPPLQVPHRSTTICIGEACAGIWAREQALQKHTNQEAELALQTLAVFLLLWLIFTGIAVCREMSFRSYLRAEISGFSAPENGEKIPLMRNIVRQFGRLNEQCPVQLGSIGEFDPCTVCLDDIDNDSAIRKLICSHVFHIACIDRWVLQSLGSQAAEMSPSCPVCKAPILQSLPPRADYIDTSIHDNAEEPIEINGGIGTVLS